MKCPKCYKVLDHYVLDSRYNHHADLIRRRRQCYSCHHKWTTIEIPVPWEDYHRIMEPVELEINFKNQKQKTLKLEVI